MSVDNSRSVFILVHEVSALGSAEQYLSNRGWKVASSTNIRAGLAALIQMQPKYFLLSVDFPHPNVASLPRVFAQAANSTVIPFGEKNTPKSYNLIQQIKGDYAVFPPVSGPAIERVLLKIEKDLEKAEQDLINQIERNENALNETSSAKNTKTSGQGSVNSLKSEDSVNHGMGTEKKDATSIAVRGGQQSGQTQGQESKKQPRGIAYMPSHSASSPNTDPSSATSQNEVKNETPAGTRNRTDTMSPIVPDSTSQGSDYQPDHAANEAGTSINGIQKDAKETTAQTKSGSSASSAASAPTKNSEASAQERSSTTQASRGGFTGTQGPAACKPGALSTEPEKNLDAMKSSDKGTSTAPPRSQSRKGESQNQARSESPVKSAESNTTSSTPEKEQAVAGFADSILILATEFALSKSVVARPVSGEPVEPLGISRHLGCLTVTTSQCSGHLVIAHGINRSVDRRFLLTFREIFTKCLRRFGGTLEEIESLELNVTPVDFEGWSRDSAEFIRKSVHRGQEVSVAFFLRTNNDQDFQSSVHTEMLSVGLEDIRTGDPMEFDAYLHLPINAKFLLYVKKHRRLLEEQKNKLLARGTQFFHFKKSEIENIKRFQLQIHFNKSIARFEERNAKENPRSS